MKNLFRGMQTKITNPIGQIEVIKNLQLKMTSNDLLGKTCKHRRSKNEGNEAINYNSY